MSHISYQFFNKQPCLSPDPCRAKQQSLRPRKCRDSEIFMFVSKSVSKNSFKVAEHEDSNHPGLVVNSRFLREDAGWNPAIPKFKVLNLLALLVQSTNTDANAPARCQLLPIREHVSRRICHPRPPSTITSCEAQRRCSSPLREISTGGSLNSDHKGLLEPQGAPQLPQLLPLTEAAV